ncbi:MAG: aldehyde dehydrogenase [Acidimicrobiales bacterium]|nr:aldehyde dehydrogenase [Acidimicrobiales bacterium]
MESLTTYQYFAGGEWQEPASGKWIESENPATCEVWARIPDCNEVDVDRAVQAAKSAFYDGPWPQMNGTERGKILRSIGDGVIANAERLGEVETRDNGKLPQHITPGLRAWQTDSFYYYAGLTDKFEGSFIPLDVPDMMNYLQWEPFGVCGLITAWNSPLGVLICKLAPALAAGNTVVIKPSEHASASTLEFMDVLQQTDLPKGVVNVVTGYGQPTGEALVAHPDVRMVSMTGGIPGGRAVAATAAQQIKPLVMELGGKSPQLVFEDADLELAVNGVASGIFPVSGQSCVSGSRAVVHSSLVDEFTKRLVTVADRARIGDPLDPLTQVGPIANRPHYEKILADIEAAEASGAALLLDGRNAGPDTGYYIGPTIFSEVSNDMDLAQHEIFGPVVGIIPFDDEEEAIRIANDSIYGLAAGIWTEDMNRAIRVGERLEAGTIYINNYFNATTQSPVGGFKQSGYGRENGVEGMRCFMQTKSVWLATNPSEPDPFPN